MGTLIRAWKTIPLPPGATVKKNIVTWTAKGKKKTGKLSGLDRVSVQVDTWTAQFTDETGKVRRVSTKTANRNAAEKILSNFEAEVDRIKSGVVTREELAQIPLRHITLDSALEKFRTKLVAGGNTASHVRTSMYRIRTVLQDCEIDSIPKIRREAVERWIADEIQKKERSLGTINSYLIIVKGFVQYLADIEVLQRNPLKSIRLLNYELDRRKVRRAMTADEVERLLQVASVTGKYRKEEKAAEMVLIYRMLLGTGLRSTELSLLTPNQIDFERCRLTVEALKTKNKKPDRLPLRPDLVQSVKEWIEAHGIQPNEKIFRATTLVIRRSFYRDLKLAEIKRKDSDGRCLDVHALRKTFGTMLANAGIPLTTTQRLMRHATPTMTAKLYIDVDPINMMQALETLPTFEKKKVESPNVPDAST